MFQTGKSEIRKTSKRKIKKQKEKQLTNILRDKEKQGERDDMDMIVKMTFEQRN